MPLKLRLQEYVRACFSGIWIESHEHEDALLEMGELCREEDWQLLNWVLLIDQHDVLNLEIASANHIEAARERHHTNDVQIDDNAVVSRGERPDRAWVSAWVWVDAADH